MTTDSNQSLKDDLAFLRGLVEPEDWRRPLWTFGAIYVAIGLAITAQIAGMAAVNSGVVPLPKGAGLAVIVAVWSVYGIVQHLIRRRGGRQASRDLRARVSGAAIIGMTLPHLTMLAVFAITAWRFHDGIFLELAGLTFCALQGGMWIVLYAVRSERWFALEGAAWLVATLAAAPSLGGEAFGGVLAAIVLALMVAPGLYMIHVARSAER